MEYQIDCPLTADIPNDTITTTTVDGWVTLDMNDDAMVDSPGK